jgi:hypothetical protein
MMASAQGIYRNGRIELVEVPNDIKEETLVIVTFLTPSTFDLQVRGINETQAADLRARLATFSVEWDSPEMDIYDDYDAVKASL